MYNIPLRTPFAPTKIPTRQRSHHHHTTPYPTPTTARSTAATRVNSYSSLRVWFSRIQILTRSTKLGCRARSTTTHAPRTQTGSTLQLPPLLLNTTLYPAALALAPAASNYHSDDYDDDDDDDYGNGGGDYDTDTATTASTDAAALPRPHQPPRSHDHLSRATRRRQ